MSTSGLESDLPGLGPRQLEQEPHLGLEQQHHLQAVVATSLLVLCAKPLPHLVLSHVAQGSWLWSWQGGQRAVVIRNTLPSTCINQHQDPVWHSALAQSDPKALLSQRTPTKAQGHTLTGLGP